MRKLKVIVRELIQTHRRLVFLDNLLEKDGALEDTENLDNYEGVFNLLDDWEQKEEELLAELCEVNDDQLKDIAG